MHGELRQPSSGTGGGATTIAPASGPSNTGQSTTYAIARGSGYRKAFHDVTTGNNTVTYGSTTFTGYQAAPGWDPVTGWGSPDARVLVRLLARAAG
jgi:hypothetical protein